MDDLKRRDRAAELTQRAAAMLGVMEGESDEEKE